MLSYSLKDIKSNLALSESNGKVLNSLAGRKPGPHCCNSYYRLFLFTMTEEELKVLVTNVTIAIQWYHGLLHTNEKNPLLAM